MRSIGQYAKFLVAAACLGLAACGGGPVEKCEPKSMPATGQEQRIAHPESSSCYVIVMTCNMCVYDQQGVLKKTKGEVCGVCLGLDF